MRNPDLTFCLHGNGYWTAHYGVHRWDEYVRPGVYVVITRLAVMDLVEFCGGIPTHPLCVVDDFGDLVRVGEAV